MRGGPVAQHCVRHLYQADGAVAHQRIGTDRAAMVEVDEDFQALADDVVRLAALDVHHEADAARIVLVARIVQALALNLMHRRGLSWNGVTIWAPGRRCPCRQERATLLPQCNVSDRTPGGKACYGRTAVLILVDRRRCPPSSWPAKASHPRFCSPVPTKDVGG